MVMKRLDAELNRRDLNYNEPIEQVLKSRIEKRANFIFDFYSIVSRVFFCGILDFQNADAFLLIE